MQVSLEEAKQQREEAKFQRRAAEAEAWPERPPFWVDLPYGPLRWLRAVTLYAVHSADLTVAAKMRQPAFWIVGVLMLWPEPMLNLLVWATLLVMIDKTSDYQLAYYVVSYRSIAFFTIGLKSSLLGYLSYFSCVSSVEANVCMHSGPGATPQDTLNQAMQLCAAPPSPHRRSRTAWPLAPGLGPWPLRPCRTRLPSPMPGPRLYTRTRRIRLYLGGIAYCGLILRRVVISNNGTGFVGRMTTFLFGKGPPMKKRPSPSPLGRVPSKRLLSSQKRLSLISIPPTRVERYMMYGLLFGV